MTTTDAAALFDDYAKCFKDGHSCYEWEHCYNVFASERAKVSPNFDLLSLHLAFYLASWGMYRGSSKLRQYDHFIHVGAVKILLKDDYESLWGKEWSDSKTDKADIDRLFELIDELKEYYSSKGVSDTDTLITKIIMGTMGCICAYDRYLVAGLKKDGITGSLGKKSFEELIDKYGTNKAGSFDLPKHSFFDTTAEYPQMKKLDCIFWQHGI